MADKDLDESSSHSVDSDFDKLLQEALDDFSRPILLPSERDGREKPSKSAPSSSHVVDGSLNSKEGRQPAAPSCPTSGQPKREKQSTDIPKDAFLDDTAKELDEVLSSIAQEDPGLAQQLRNLTDCAAGVSSSDHNEAMRSFSQFTAMFKETLKSVSSQAGMPAEELLDEDLDDIMENLDKLAMGSPRNCASDARKNDNLDFSVPLNDVVKALLAKDVMYSSLQRCEEEFLPWLEANRTGISVDDLRRFESQLVCVKNLLREYESHQPDAGSSDEHFQRLLVMIAELQDLGAFPEDLMSKVNVDAFFNGNTPKDSTGSAKSTTDLEPPDCKTS